MSKKNLSRFKMLALLSGAVFMALGGSAKADPTKRDFDRLGKEIRHLGDDIGHKAKHEKREEVRKAFHKVKEDLHKLAKDVTDSAGHDKKITKERLNKLGATLHSLGDEFEKGAKMDKHLRRLAEKAHALGQKVKDFFRRHSFR